MNIEAIDKNFKAPEIAELPDVEWFDVRREPFEIYGLLPPIEGDYFRRLPVQLVENLSVGLRHLSNNTAGGRVRFSTDSPYIALSVRFDHPDILAKPFHHMPAVGKFGFDLYVDLPLESQFVTCFVPALDKNDGYDTFRNVSGMSFFDGKKKKYTINFPLYNGVGQMRIGIKRGCVLEGGAKYRNTDPIVYYGSSITQGGCASRPGNSYQGFITRRLNVDHINLGFSGNAKGEPEMAEYIAGLKMSAFVCDYDHNAPSVEHLEATYESFYRIIRRSQPELPYIMVSRPDVVLHKGDSARRIDVISSVYDKARAEGDKNVYLINGASLFAGIAAADCTVDGAHPNDLGFFRMSQVIGDMLERII